jgi:hypothetical protein
MRDIAKVGRTEAGMFGPMDRLAEAVVESTERIKTLERNHTMVRELSGVDKTSEQLATMTAMMAKLMDRMAENLEHRKRGTQSVKPEPTLSTPNKEATKHRYGVGNGRDGPKVYTDWGETARAVNGFSGAVYQRCTSSDDIR